MQSSHETLKNENDTWHEEIAFKNEELEETRDKLEVTRERYRQEVEDLRNDLTVAKKLGMKSTGLISEMTGSGLRSPLKGWVSGEMAETYDANGNETATGDDAAECIKNLEDQLELVTK